MVSITYAHYQDMKLFLFCSWKLHATVNRTHNYTMGECNTIPSCYCPERLSVADNLNQRTMILRFLYGLIFGLPSPQEATKVVTGNSRVNSFPNDNFWLFQTQRLADKFGENGGQFSKRVGKKKNTEGKEEIDNYKQFLLFRQCFQKTCTKQGLVWRGLINGQVFFNYISRIYPER